MSSNESAAPSKTDRTKATVSADQLTVKRGVRVALDQLSFRFFPGEIVAVIGPNGAGKSTLFSAIAGLLPITSGAITLCGQDASSPARTPALVAEVGLIDQPPSVFEFLTVFEQLEFVAATRTEALGDRGAVWGVASVVNLLGLGKMASRLIRELSFGMRQRVGMAAALLGGPAVIIADESLNGLDPHATVAAEKALRSAAEAGATVLLSTHLLDRAQPLCTRAIVLGRGQLIRDVSTDELRDLQKQGARALESHYLEWVDDLESEGENSATVVKKIA